MIRRQLPAYSPLPLRAAAQGIGRAVLGRDPRPDLEALLLARHGAAGVRLTGSGTQALDLALRTARAGGRLGRAVALPAFGCFDLATAAVGAEVPVCFYDLDPRTLQPDPESLEGALSSGAGTLVAAPLYGYPLAWEAVIEPARRHGALLIEDAAQGFGLETAIHGDLLVLSFGRGKGWTGGRGGALLAREGTPLLDASAMPSAGSRSLGVGTLGLGIGLIAQWALGRPWLYGLPAALPWLALGETVYHEPVLPAPMERGASAVALATLPAAEAEVERRRRVAAQLLSVLGERAGRGLFPIEETELAGEPAYLRLPLLATSGMRGFTNPAAAARAGILPSYPRPLPELPALAPRRSDPGRAYPGASELVRRLLTVASHSRLGPRDLGRLGTLFEGYRTEALPQLNQEKKS